jgi:Glycolipid 2-alpha-mannosyltransferase
MASGPVEYAVVPQENWEVPEWVNKTTMQEEMMNMENAQIIYGGSLSYRFAALCLNNERLMADSATQTHVQVQFRILLQPRSHEKIRLVLACGAWNRALL